MRRPWRLFETALTIGGVAWLAWYLHGERETLASVLRAPPGLLTALLVLVLVGWVAIAAQSVVLMRSQGVRLGGLESLMLHAATSLLNYVPMRLGTVLRLRYLRVVHGLGYERALGLVALRMGVLAGLSAAMALTGLAMLGRAGEAALLAVGLAGLGVASLGLVWAVRPAADGAARGRTWGLALRLWNGFAAAIGEARARRDRLALIVLLVAAQLGFGAARMHVAFVAAGVPVEPGVLMIVAPVTVLLGLFSFATLGVREALIGALAAATGHDFAAGVVAGTLERGALMALSVALGTVGVAVMRRRMRWAGG